MKTKTFLIPCVVQVPTGVKQIALQKWNALLKTLIFLCLAARCFCLPFRVPFLGGRTAVLKNIGLRSALFVFLGLFNLEVVGHDLDVSSLLMLLGPPLVLRRFLEASRLFVARCVRDSRIGEREQFACEAVSSGGSRSSSGAGCVALLDRDSLAVPIDLPAGTRWGFRPLMGVLSQARKLHRRAIESLNTSFVPHSRLLSIHPSLVSQNSSLSHGLGAMNSCGSMHGLCMHDNSLVMHDNSWGALEHKNSCSLHAAGVRGGTKAPSTSTRIRGRRSAVEKLASPQQTSSKLHVEVWEGLLSNRGMKFSQEEEIVTGCVVSRARPSCLDGSPEPPGPGRVIRNMFGWSKLEKTVRSGVWLFRGALRGENLFSSLCAAGDWVRKGSYHTAWAVPGDSSCTCSYAYGRGPPLSGLTLVGGAGRCLLVCGGLSHP